MTWFADRWQNLSLSARLLVAVGTILFITSTLAQYWQMRDTIAEYQRHIDADIASTVNVTRRAIEQDLIIGDYAAIQQILDSSATQKNINEIVLHDPRKGVVQARNVKSATQAPDWFRNWLDFRLQAVTSPIYIGGVSYGELTLQGSAASQEDRLWHRFLVQLATQATEIILIFVMITWLLRRNFGPIKLITQAISRFTDGDLQIRMTSPTDKLPPEMRIMVASLNQAADNIEAALQSLSAQRHAIDNAAIVVESDMSGHITYVNDKFCEISGYSRKELLGQHHRILDSDYHPAAFFEDLWSSVNAGQIWHGEICYRNKYGGVFWVDNTITPFPDASGKPAKYISVRFDITDRKIAEEQIRLDALMQQAISDILRLSLSKTHMDELLAHALRIILSLPMLKGKARGCIFLNREDDGALVMHAQSGMPEAQQNDRRIVKHGECICGKAAHTRAAFASQLENPAQASGSPVSDESGHICMPIKSANRPLGIVSLHVAPEYHCTQASLRLFEVIADTLGGVIERTHARSLTERLGQILDSSLNEIYLFDADTLQFLLVNQGARNNLKHSMDELRAMTPLDIMPNFNAELFGALLRPLREGLIPQMVFEVMHRRKNGTTYPAEVHLQYTQEESGAAFLAVVQDLTERKDIEQSLQFNKEKFQALVETTGDWFWEIDRRGYYSYASPRVRDILGYEPDEVIGRRPQDFMPKSEAMRLTKLLQKPEILSDPLLLMENSMLHKDGRAVTLETTSLPIHDNDGKLLGYRGTNRDITTRKLDIAALIESEARLKGMAGNVPGIVFQFMLGTGGTLKFLYASEGAMEVCGITPEMIVADASNFLELISANDIATFKKTMASSLKNHQTWNWEGRISFKGKLKWVNLRASHRIMENGNIIWDGLMLNITEAKTAELELQQSQAQLRELSTYLQTVREEEKTWIAREIHDELGGVLTALKMDTFWLAGKLPKDQQHLVSKIDTMSSLIDNAIRTTRRISTELRPTVLDDLGLVAAMEWQIGEFRSRMNIECEATLAQIDDVLPEPHSIALFRILQESLTNITRHAQATQVRISLNIVNDTINLSVSDNGKGISEDRILNPTSHGIRGMFERARHLNGDIQINSSPGNGTTILARIPINQDVRQTTINE